LDREQAMPQASTGGEIARRQRLERLRAMLERHRGGGGGGPQRFVPTGVAGLDAVLPRGGLPGGAVTEVLSAFDGVGAMTLAFRAAMAAAEGTRAVVVVDTRGDLYPPAVWRLGVAVDGLIVVRVRRPAAVVWVVDQALRCSGVGAVVAPIDRLDEAASRRLQLAAESCDGLGLLIRPAARRGRSFAAVQMCVEPVGVELSGGESTGLNGRYAGSGNALIQGGRPGLGVFPVRLCRVTLLKVREGMPAGPFLISLDDETGVGALLSVSGDRPAEGGGSVARRVSA